MQINVFQTYAWYRVQHAGQAIAMLTKSPVGQSAAASARGYGKFVSANPYLADEPWFTLAGRSKVSVEEAVALARSACTSERAETMSADSRCSVYETLLDGTVDLGPDVVARIESAVPRFKALPLAIACSPRVPIEVSSRYSRSLTGYRRARAYLGIASRQPAAEAVDTLLDSSIRIMQASASAFTTVLDTRPDLVVALLDALADGKAPSVRDRDWLLWQVAESRHFPTDGWEKIKGLIGTKVTWSNPRGYVLAAVAGNPNTARAGAAWAVDNLVRLSENWGKLDYRMPEAVAQVVAVRQLHDLEPVTVDWSRATGSQRDTLARLGTAGICATFYGGQHPREILLSGTALPPYLQDGRRIKPGSTPVVRPWASRTGAGKVPVFDPRNWAPAMVGVGTHVDKRMKAASCEQWEMLFMLADGWSGTVDELVDAALAL